MDVRSRPVSSTQTWRGKCSRSSEISSSVLVERCGGTTSLGVVSLGVAVATIATAFFLGFAAADCCSFGFGLLRPGRLPRGGHFRLLGRLLDRLE